MIKTILKYLYMVKLGFKYIHIYKKTFFHPFISQKAAYKQLSIDRGKYSNSVLNYLNIEVKQIGQLPQKDHVLYAINHRSLLDIIVMENIFSKHDKSGVWIAKQELFDAIYGDFFRYSGCISVDLEGGKGLLNFFKSIKTALKKVNNLNIYIFPEGERNKDDGIMKFQSGAQKIAKSNKLDIVPVFINDKLEDIFQQAPFETTKTIEVHIGNIIKHNNLEEDYIKFMQDAKNKGGNDG